MSGVTIRSVPPEFLKARAQCLNIGRGSRGNRVENVTDSGEPCLDSRFPEMHAALHHAANIPAPVCGSA